jgi:hypothetical protein
MLKHLDLIRTAVTNSGYSGRRLKRIGFTLQQPTCRISLSTDHGYNRRQQDLLSLIALFIRQLDPLTISHFIAFGHRTISLGAFHWQRQSKSNVILTMPLDRYLN